MAPALSPRTHRRSTAARAPLPFAAALLTLVGCVDVPQRPLIDAMAPPTDDLGPMADAGPPDARPDPMPDAAEPEPDAAASDADLDAAAEPEPDADLDMALLDMAPPDMALLDMASPDMALPDMAPPPDMGAPNPLVWSDCLRVAVDFPIAPEGIAPPCLQVAIGASMPVASRWQAAVALDGGRVAFVGGLIPDDDGERTSNRLDIYDPATNTWSTGPALAQARWGHVAGLLSTLAAEPDQLLVAGGAPRPPDVAIGGAGEPLVTGEAWRVGQAAWQPPVRLLSATRVLATGLIDDGALVIAGGIEIPGGAVPQDVVRWRPGDEAAADEPEELGRGRYGHSMVRFQFSPVVIGGADEAGGLVDSLELFGLRGWETFNDPGFSRVHAAAVALGDTLLVVGGQRVPFDRVGEGGPTLLSSSSRYTRRLGVDFMPVMPPETNPTMRRQRSFFTLSPLAGIFALAVGGEPPAANAPVIVELYDARGANPVWWPYALEAPADIRRAFHTAASLPGGRVVIAGGRETLDPAAGVGPLLDQVLVFRISPLGDLPSGGVDTPD